jgi:hypothetical protein
MQAAMGVNWPGSAQKAKLVVLFCVLGCAMFLLNLGAGLWLWKHIGEYGNAMPAYDRFLADVRQADSRALADIALAMHSGWEVCEQARSGIQETVVHMTLAASFIGLALFSLCFVLGFQLYGDLVRRAGGPPEPIPPDDVDETWR